MTNKTATLTQINDILDQVDVLVRDLQLDKKDQLRMQDAINQLYDLIERTTEKTTKIEHVKSWGFTLNTNYATTVYTRNAPNGHTEIWRKANPDRIFIYNKQHDLIETFNINWSLHS